MQHRATRISMAKGWAIAGGLCQLVFLMSDDNYTRFQLGVVFILFAVAGGALCGYLLEDFGLWPHPFSDVVLDWKGWAMTCVLIAGPTVGLYLWGYLGHVPRRYEQLFSYILASQSAQLALIGVLALFSPWILIGAFVEWRRARKESGRDEFRQSRAAQARLRGEIKNRYDA